MKKILLTFLILSTFPIKSNGQITLEENIVPAEFHIEYDSLNNINPTNIMALKGQTLFVKGGPFSKEYGFSFTFYEEKGFPSDRIKKNVYKGVTSNKMGYNLIVTPYDSVIGKYFLIKDVYENKKRFSNAYEYCLYVREKISGEDLYIYLDNVDSPTLGGLDDFIILGYYEKLKEKYIGKKYKSFGNNKFNDRSNIEQNIKAGTTFLCTDISISLGEHNNLCAILSNKQIGDIKGVILDNGIISNVIDEAEYSKWVKKYGKYYADLIIAKKVETGMNREMARLSWGTPDDINTTSGNFGTHEQWVYKDGNYLYFDNGKLTSIQNQ